MRILKVEGRNYFEPDEPWNNRFIEPHDFKMLQEMLRDAEVSYRKEQIKFELWKVKQQELGVKTPVYEMLETYKDKEILKKEEKQYQRNTIFMEMFLQQYPQAIINGNYRGWKDIYERRYDNPKDFCNYCNKEL